MAVPLWCVAAAVLAVFIYYIEKVRRTLPPGPIPFPLLGNIPHFAIGALQGKSNVDVMTEWKHKYGGVYTMWIGPTPMVLVCDFKTATDAFIKTGDAHAGRAKTFVFQKVRENELKRTLGIVFNDGPIWQEQRRFALSTLRNFGFGRNLMQYRILEEAFHRFDILDEQIHRTGGKVTIDPTPMLDLMIGSIINVLLAGYRYDEDSTEYMALKHSLDQSMDIITPLDQILFNEYTYQLPLLRKRWSVLVQPQTDIITLMRRQVRDRKAEIAKGEHHLDLSGTGDDFIDAYLIEMKKREMAGEELGAFNEENLCATLLDLWVAGTETTISTLLWVFIYLANRSTVQDKLRAELIAVTKGNRRVELADKTSLPFTCAVVTEALRCGNIVNFNVFHQTTCETQVGDYMLPAGTVITPQVSVITMDEGAFINPHDFDPDRYINDKNLEKQVIPFSLGKRSCLGESLARAEMFLILANFVQKYKILPPTGSGPLSEEQQSLTSMLRRSRKYQILVEPVH